VRLSLRKELLIWIALVFVLAVGGTHLVSRLFLLRSFAELEQSFARQNATRAFNALQSDMDHLAATCLDYAAWDDTRDFLQGRMPKYADTNLVASVFSNLKLNLMLFADAHGNVKDIRWFDLEKQAFFSDDPEVRQQILSLTGLIQHDSAASSKTGLLLVGRRPLLLSSRPITNSAQEGPPQGALVMGRFLHERHLEDISKRVQQTVKLLWPDQLDAELNAALAQAPADGGPSLAVQVANAGRIDAYCLVRDLPGRGAVILGLEMPRDIMAHGRRSVAVFHAMLLLVATGVILALYVAIARYVMGPATRLMDEIAEVAGSGDLSRRLPPWRQDELGRLAATVNRMLDAHERAVAERQQLAERIQRAQRMESLNVMAASIAHRFNNLLHVVIGNHDLAQSALPQDSSARHFLDEADKAARLASEISRAMSIYSGEAQTAVQPISLNAVIREMRGFFGAAAPANVEMQYELADTFDLISADPAQIRQIMVNLFVNAVEAIGPQNGRVIIRTGSVECREEDLRNSYHYEEQKAGFYEFCEVEDTGCGMDDQTRARMFDPYFTTKFPGRGMGLAVVIGIVRSYAGAITVRSQPGQGSAIRILFPRAEAGPEESPDRSSPNPAAVNRVWQAAAGAPVAQKGLTDRG